MKAKDETHLGEERELGELPRHDVDRGRHLDPNHEILAPAAFFGLQGHRDEPDLQEGDRVPKALPQGWRPHDPGALLVVVEEAQDGQESSKLGITIKKIVKSSRQEANIC